MTILGITCWRAGGPRQYHVYCSHVLEQSHFLAASCVLDLLRHVGMDGVRKLRCWADCGGHFRSGYFLSVLTSHVMDTYRCLTESSLYLFPEGHGKGVCDGLFGRMDESAWHVLKACID